MNDYIHEELIFLDWEVEDRQELFEKISQILGEKQFIKEGFLDYLNNREDNYPTALELEGYSVAIPHGDPSYINKSFISIIRLMKPIKMYKMEDSTEQTEVDLFFILGLLEGNEHLSVLKQLINLFQDEETIKKLKQATLTEEILTILNQKTRKEG
ncbi:PTS sugar transporter subunit IIA [Aerococcaceae bacterium WGS1372]